MADEGRKGPPKRRRSGPQPRDAAEQSGASAGGLAEAQGDEQQRQSSPRDAAAFDAEELDESIRAREQEDRGEVF